MTDLNALKFLHFNIERQKEMSKGMLHLWQSRTVAALAIEPEEVQGLANQFLGTDPSKPIMARMAVGVTFVSKDDMYNRQTGRDQAVKNMEEIELEVVSVNVNSTHIYVNLEAYKGVSLTLRLNKRTRFSTIVGQLSGKHEDRD